VGNGVICFCVGSSFTAMTLSPLGSKRGSAWSPVVSAACTRFCVAQPGETKRWWSSGSTAGQRRAKSGAREIDRSAILKRQHCV